MHTTDECNLVWHTLQCEFTQCNVEIKLNNIARSKCIMSRFSCIIYIYVYICMLIYINCTYIYIYIHAHIHTSIYICINSGIHTRYLHIYMSSAPGPVGRWPGPKLNAEPADAQTVRRIRSYQARITIANQCSSCLHQSNYTDINDGRPPKSCMIKQCWLLQAHRSGLAGNSPTTTRRKGQMCENGMQRSAEQRNRHKTALHHQA